MLRPTLHALLHTLLAQITLIGAHDQAAGDFGCMPADLGNGTCYHNPAGRFGSTLSRDSAEECCDVCKTHAGCLAWTWFGGNQCNLFSDVGPTSSSDRSCVSGMGAPMPPARPDPEKGPWPPFDPQPWQCKHPQPDGSCIHSDCKRWTPPPPHGPPCKDCPNIVFSLTDDQDVALGGWNPMTKTQDLLEKTGALLTNWRIHTPICSPSRSETVSGRYFHNIKSPLPVPPIKLQGAATGHIDGSLYNNDSFGVHLREKKGYNVAIFGKANFNTCEGFDRWFQGAFLGYGGGWQDNEAANFSYHGKPTDYATALIGNKSLEWLGRPEVSGAQSQGRPFFLYFAPHCPHTPAYPADWYRDACQGVTSPRIPSYNYSAEGFHELVARQPPLTEADGILIDDLARRRCQCLLSVDDAHAAIIQATKALGVFDKTYFVISSDHGYNLGHHRIPSNKFLLYDHATRIPAVIRGPGIPGGEPNAVLGTNVDYAPTWLAMAGIPTPPTMDGRSILPQLIPASAEPRLPPPTRAQLRADRAGLAKRPWRTVQFHEYYNQGGPSPTHPQQCQQNTPTGFRPCEGWSPGSSTNPTQTPGDLSPQTPKIAFPRDVGLHATVRPLDDYSNTYIGVHSTDPTIGTGHYKYAEYQYVCSSAQIAAKDCFSNIDMYQLFDLTKDPYELHNVYNTTPPAIRKALAARLREFYPCQGVACP